MENIELNSEQKEMKSIEAKVTALNEILQEAWMVPFTGGKCLVERDQMLDILEDLRINVPDEIRRAQSVLASRQEILDSAKNEADNIVRSAQNRASALTENNAITQEATRRAKEILAEASAQAAKMIAEAQAKANDAIATADKRARELRESSYSFLETSLSETVDVVNGTLAELKTVQGKLRAMSAKQ